MNRRMFLRVVGLTVAGFAGLPLVTHAKTEYGGPYLHCPCETCKAGLPATSIHWMILPTKPIILNDLAITKIILTDNEAKSGLSDTNHNILCGHIGSKLHVSNPSKAGEKANVFFSPYRGQSIQET